MTALDLSPGTRFTLRMVGEALFWLAVLALAAVAYVLIAWSPA
jgi:hypothetical protein